uniref:Large ribosomal subunit protein uL22 n=1 Tax=uncultured actinobacterium Rifle_16ft_4_minimus_550 TaxID=1665149 RepID=A0A0H4TUE2_9ACTN|nr:50S ribosomal protein L22, large subunit ribosomal protein L22 [uncultured actinobacterium Rifle_16ft_4_minimus_550]
MSETAVAEKNAKAVARYIRIAPRKTRAAIDLIRGKKVDEAVSTLRLSPRTGAKAVLKVVNSALANAEKQLQQRREDLYVKRAYVDQGPTLRRFRPRAMGRAARIRKKTSHITIILAEGGE